MPNQYTLKNSIEFTKIEPIEPFGGNIVDIEIEPAPKDTGFVFRSEGKEVKACLKNTKATMCTTVIINEQLKVLNSEHILATFCAYYISNALINIRTHYSKSREFFRNMNIAKDTVVIPYFGTDLQKNVCTAIESVGTLDQKTERPIIKLKQEIISSNSQLKITPIKGEALEFKVITDYPIIGKQIIETTITPKNYKYMAGCRSYNKHMRPEKIKTRGLGKHVPRLIGRIFSEEQGNVIARYLCYPWLGFNHGFSRDTNFVAPYTRTEWLKQERIPSEIGGHSIIDGLGKIALLNGKLTGARIECQYAGHKTYLKTFKQHFK